MKTQQIIAIVMACLFYPVPLLILLIKYRPKKFYFDWYMWVLLLPIVCLVTQYLDDKDESPPFAGY